MKKKYNTEFKVGTRIISQKSPTYFIADIAANHDGEISRAKELIWIAKEAGADCAKFQHFLPEKIISDYGFKNMNSKVSHQKNWKDSVFKIYEKYHTKRNWTNDLVETCKKAKIDFMTTPYDIEAIEMFKDKVPGFKVGSGDLTFYDLLNHLSKIKKPIFLATGASTLQEVKDAVKLILKKNKNICIMQCNTNYTNDQNNFNFLNLNVIKQFKKIWPGLPLGLSDHTQGHTSVLGAIALGVRVVEKHFTDENSREGPDHGFAMNPKTWRVMVESSRELEASLGDGEKKIEKNENLTAVIQRRSIRLKVNLKKNSIIKNEHLECLRPRPKNAISPMLKKKLINKKLIKNKVKGDFISWKDIEK
tara:strand:+ start:90 stop:1175 length:1086 start_codon:yes stop_codon:yes gene_type:complete